MATASLHAVVGYARRIVDRDARHGGDRQLLERFIGQRDEAAFAELVRRHGPMVLAACRRVLRHQQDAEDSFQAAFLVLARKATSISERDSVGGWLYQVAIRLALRARVAAQRRRQWTVPLGEVSETPDRIPDLAPCLDEELQRLPEQYRTAVVLCYLEGRTQVEAARQLATTTDAVNSRLKRAREMLRNRLARQGLALSSAALAEALTGAVAQAALPTALIGPTARAALHFVSQSGSACGASAAAAALAKGALIAMGVSKIKLATMSVVAAGLLAGMILFAAPPAQGDPAATAADDGGAGQPRQPQAKAPIQDNAKPPKSVIILWMGGGPSQIDTFDPKPAHVNGALFEAIETNVKGLQISKTLPKLAKQANHLAIIRTMSHREGDHFRGAFRMRTGFEVSDAVQLPPLGSLLAKELGDARPDLPRYFTLGQTNDPAMPSFGPGFLGEAYGAHIIAKEPFALPAVEDFETRAQGKGAIHRKAVAKAFDLSEEKADVHDSYGHNQFGQACLLARRLVERGVPVVEIHMGGWDMHGDIPKTLPKRCAELDAGWASLLKDLHAGKRLDSTLIVWMGEFGRTPVINKNAGRDHWPMCFSVVLAGAGIKGGQAIGKTSGDGIRIEERPVSPAELHATIYWALGIDPHKENRTGALRLPLVEKGTQAVKEALR